MSHFWLSVLDFFSFGESVTNSTLSLSLCHPLPPLFSCSDFSPWGQFYCKHKHGKTNVAIHGKLHFIHEAC